MKKYVVGFIVGVIFATTATVYADDGLEKIEAFLRPGLPITLNGQKVQLESPPVMVDGSTYLKLRDVAALTGIQVNWNEATQTVELGNKGSVPVEKPIVEADIKRQEEMIKTYELTKELEQIDKELAELGRSIGEYGKPAIDSTGRITRKEPDAFYTETKKKIDTLNTRRDEILNELEERNKINQAQVDAQMAELKSKLEAQKAELQK